MKNLLRTLLIFSFVLIHSESVVWAQTYTLKKPAGEALNKELMEFGKQMFEPSGTLEYNITTNDIMSSFDEMQGATDYTVTYKELQETALKTDSTNAVIWNNLGNYYNTTGDKEAAKKHFQKAYDLLAVTFSKDSSYFYSFKGILELNLGMTGALEDLQYAAQINPSDSIAIAFLPIMLLNSGEFAKAKTYCSDAIEKSNGNHQGTWYIFFLMADLFEQFGALQASEHGFEQFRDSEYDQVIDFSRINAILEQHKTNQSMINAKLMADILGLYFKLITFEFKDGKFKLNYTKKELKRLNEIKGELIAMEGKSMMNEYSRIKNLAFISFFLGKTALSKTYFEQATTLFPKEKRNDSFTPMNCYDALFCIYDLEKNLAKEESILERMIKLDEEEDHTPSVKRYSDLAKCYLQEDNYEELSKTLDKAFLTSPTDFETLRLLIHYYFFYRVDRKASEEYFNTAIPLISSEDQNYSLCIQLVIYAIANGDVTSARQYIQSARDTYPGEPCEQCDELEKKYIQVSK